MTEPAHPAHVLAIHAHPDDIERVRERHEAEFADRADARHTFAVDAPDGTPDNELKRGRKEVDQIIGYEATHPDEDMSTADIAAAARVLQAFLVSFDPAGPAAGPGESPRA